ncbi:MAG: hypothetical protein AAF327_00910 [Cyanobacteria bacterium P01_A01_bin.37]
MTQSSIDDITQQARQGSVAAIIQVLNDRLADCGVRTRAVLAQGILQLLCEADTTECLERDSLVHRIRQILGGLRPRHIRRVKINSRLVKEQQLLWLDEIQRDPEGQLLWTEEISLPRPNPIQLLVEDFTSPQKREKILVTPTPSRQSRDRRQFARGIMGGAGLSVLLLLLGWIAYDRLGTRGEIESAEIESAEINTDESINTPSSLPTTDNPSQESNPLTSDAPVAPVQLETSDSSETAQPTSNATTIDPFEQAVLLAQQAATDGQSASTAAEWLELASRWQRASDLMGQVSVSDERHATAQDRQMLYQSNSDEALKQADLHQAEQGVN